MVVSPFISNEKALERGKKDYVIEPEKIKGVHEFWKEVENEAMESIEFDEDVYSRLPHDQVSLDIFFVE